MSRLALILFALFLDPAGPLLQAQTIRAVEAVLKTVPGKTPATYQGRQIMVGSGGGFTGLITTYYLLDNGKLFGRRSRDTSFTFIRQQPTATTQRLFNRVENTCKIRKTKFNNPGNMYKFVRWRKGKQEYAVTWGETGKTVPANYPVFYNSFMAAIPATSRLK